MRAPKPGYPDVHQGRRGETASLILSRERKRCPGTRTVGCVQEPDLGGDVTAGARDEAIAVRVLEREREADNQVSDSHEGEGTTGDYEAIPNCLQEGT